MFSKKNFFTNTEKAYFQKRKKNIQILKTLLYSFQIIHEKRLFLAFIVLGTLIILGIGVIFGPFFRVQNILIVRQGNIINIDQSYESVNYIRGKNILFLNTGDIVARLQKSQRAIQSIKFKVHFPHTIDITLQSYPAIFQTNDTMILSNGAVLAKENISLSDLPFIHLISNNKDLFLFGNTLNIEELKNITSIINEIKKNIPGFQYTSLQYFIAEKELILGNTKDTLFLFDLGGNIKQQVDQLVIFHKERSDLSEKKYIYLDLRIANKIFLCGYENEYSCRKNITNIYNNEVFTVQQKALSEYELSILPQENRENQENQQDEQ